MKRTGTTSWFHRDIPKARRPYTSTTWARQKNAVCYWFSAPMIWYQKHNQQYSHKEAKDNSHGISHPKEKEIHQITVWQRENPDLAARYYHYLEVERSTWLCSKLSEQLNAPSYQELAGSCWLKPTCSQRGDDTGLQLTHNPSGPFCPA